MGKVRTRTIGLEEEEKKQKQEQKQKAQEKKMEKKETVEKVETETKKEIKVEKKEKKRQIKARVRGKKYTKAKKTIEKNKAYGLNDAVSLLKKIKFAGFDESVELHLNVLNDSLKGETNLPHSTGKTVRVRVVDDNTLSEIEAGKLDFDVLVTHPSFMPKLAKYARILGPKGLMPSPKSGTITDKPEEVVKKFSGGTLRWKTEPKASLIHQMVGKASLDDRKLADNIKTFIKSVGKQNIQKVFIKTTMSPSLKLDLNQL